MCSLQAPITARCPQPTSGIAMSVNRCEISMHVNPIHISQLAHTILHGAEPEA